MAWDFQIYPVRDKVECAERSRSMQFQVYDRASCKPLNRLCMPLVHLDFNPRFKFADCQDFAVLGKQRWRLPINQCIDIDVAVRCELRLGHDKWKTKCDVDVA